MPAAKTLADLNDGRFNEEPKWKKGGAVDWTGEPVVDGAHFVECVAVSRFPGSR